MEFAHGQAPFLVAEIKPVVTVLAIQPLRIDKDLLANDARSMGWLF